MMDALKEIGSGFWSLVTGMRITLGEFFKPTVTVHYPHQTLKIPPRFRGHIELVRDPSTGRAVCFACKLCERACPSDCITVEGVKLEGAKKRSVSAYTLDFTKCSLCGSCVEACRDGAIRFSRDYNMASTSKDEFVMDLFKRLEDEAKADGVWQPPPPPAAAPVTAAPAAAAPATAPKAEAAKPALPKAEAPKTEAPKTEVPQAEAAKAPAPKAELSKPEKPKATAPKPEPAKVEAK